MFDNFEILLESFIHSNLFNENNCKKKNNYPNNKKKIKFSSLVRVQFIPFFYEENIPSLWWTPYELMDFKMQATKEIMELKQKHPHISILDAQKLLYQPNNISYDENNFSHYNQPSSFFFR